MKRIQKTIGLLIAAVMVLGLFSQAFAFGENGTQAAAAAAVNAGGVIDDATLWTYFEGGQVDENWYTEGYDDSAWKTGVGPFGDQSDSADGTVNEVSVGTRLEGCDGEANVPVYYFRTQFTVEEGELESIEKLTGVLEYDDAAVVYLNGQKIYEGSQNGGEIADLSLIHI